MEKPLRIDSRNIVLPESIAKRIQRKAAKLDRAFDRITSCRVTVEAPNGVTRKGGRFHVRLDLTVPGKEIVISRHHAENLAIAVREAFDAAQRRLEEYSRIRRNDVKRRQGPPHGRVIRLFPESGFGFIQHEEDGREVYFHRNSVLESGFERLQVGARVRFAEEQGDEGPQASSVTVLA